MIRSDERGGWVLDPSYEPSQEFSTAKLAIRGFYDGRCGIGAVCYVLEGEWVVESRRLGRLVWHWDSNTRYMRLVMRR